MRENVIFCYSGTGNCLAMAKTIARELGDTDIILQRGSLPKAVFHYWFHNSAVLEALVQIHRTDILSDSLRRSTGLIEALRPLTDDRAQFDYFAAIITSGMIGVLTVWVEHGKTETEAQMVQKLAGAFAEMALLELHG